MPIQKIDSTNFSGFEFKNAHAKCAFEEKLGKISETTACKIKKYLDQTKTEENKIIINSTYSRMFETNEYALFATFSNSDKIINERYNHTNSLKDFIKKCAKVAGYKSIN